MQVEREKGLKVLTRISLVCFAAGLFAVSSMSSQGTGVVSAAGAYTVAVEGNDGGLWVNHGSGFMSLGGGIIGAPAVASLPNGTDLYLAVGGNDQLYERTDGIGWQLLSTTTTSCLDNPAATVSSGTLTVACMGTDHALHYATTAIPSSGLPSVGALGSLGGGTSYGPAVAPVGGTMTFFVIGLNHELWERTTSQGWTPLGGWCQGHPAAASNGTTTYLACEGGNGGLYYMTNSGSGWSGFYFLGGGFYDGPGVAATASGPVFVGEGYNYGTWANGGSGWVSLGGGIQHGAAAVADTAPVSTGGTCPGSQSGCMQALLNIINQHRARFNIAPLTLNMTQSNGTGSCMGSYGHSVAMANSGSIWHVAPGDNQTHPTNPASFPNEICIPYSIAGENVGMSSSGNELNDLQTIDSMMMSENPNTPSTCGNTVNHACNILNANYHQIGIGIYYVNNATWVTEDFTN